MAVIEGGVPDLNLLDPNQGLVFTARNIKAASYFIYLYCFIYMLFEVVAFFAVQPTQLTGA